MSKNSENAMVKNSEIIFVIEEAMESGYTARSLGASIFTEGETLAELKTNIREAVSCHFEDNRPPSIFIKKPCKRVVYKAF